MNPRAQNQNLKPYPKLPEGVRATKPLRFTLPTALADRLEGMTKGQRDAVLIEALGVGDLIGQAGATKAAR